MRNKALNSTKRSDYRENMIQMENICKGHIALFRKTSLLPLPVLEQLRIFLSDFLSFPIAGAYH